MDDRYDGVLFDLLTGLLDSWSLWDRVAGGREMGRRWRLRYLDRTYVAGAYRPYEALVTESARAVGLGEAEGGALVTQWEELEPWPEAGDVLAALKPYRLGIVTNCSEDLARTAVARLGVRVDVMVSAERAGAYKPDRRPYELAVRELGVGLDRTLYVAGSPYDVLGATGAGLPVFWHNRIRLEHAAGSRAVAEREDLRGLPSFVQGGCRDDQTGP